MPPDITYVEGMRRPRLMPPGVTRPRSTTILSARTKEIADGLMRTGRASDPRIVHGHLRLRATRGGFYWIAPDGARMLRGDELEFAEELQPNFTQAMAQAGQRR
jgi:hypothetical protein